MTTLREAAQQALEAMEAGADVDPIFAGEAIDTLRAALAEPVETVNKTTAQRRERIAAAALQGVLANFTQWLPPDTTWEQIAAYSIRAADALIAELDKPKEQPK